jgi:YHS domain-containing protein
MNDKFRSKAAWSDASSYAVADVKMLRKELVIGYVIAGFLAALVPNHIWNALFLHGHGVWTSIENALVGPLIAIISWVCSVGNVPLAAALWSGGISFGGVIAFIFADLIAMPLIIIYRKFYGTKLTMRIVALFYVIMTLAGLLTEGIFSLFGGIPTHKAISIKQAHFEWNYTTYLNFIFIIVAIMVWWLARNRAKFGGGVGYAIDPVCGMQVRTADAPATTMYQGAMIHFCSDRCKDRFVANPQRFAGAGAASEGMKSDETTSAGIPKEPTNPLPAVTDPICGMSVDPATAVAHRALDGDDYWFCSTDCATTFDEQKAPHPPAN